MKKFFAIFFLGQMILLAYIFNTSIYNIYELNNIVDNDAKGYIIEKPNGENLNTFYKSIYSEYLENDDYQFQIVKTPISEDEKFIYDIYSSNIKSVRELKSIDGDKVYNYYKLKDEDFIDSMGVFYTDIPSKNIYEISNELGIYVSSYSENGTSYNQVLKYNSINIITLIVLTQVIMFIYTFMSIKTNAIKKMLGYTSIKMLNYQFKRFIRLEFIIIAIVELINIFISMVTIGININYLVLLLIFCIGIAIINCILLSFTAISIRAIDINSILKNKIFSDKINFTLHFTKIILILLTTISISLFLDNYDNYRIKGESVEKYKKLSVYYTSNGFNSNENDKALSDKLLLGKYGESIKEIYKLFNNKGNIYVRDSYILELLSENSLKNRGKNKSDIIESIKENNLVLNIKYINEFSELKDEFNNPIKLVEKQKARIIVPEKYKEQESDIKTIYIDKYNKLLDYNKFYDLESGDIRYIDDIEVIYAKNNQVYTLLGKESIDNESNIIDSIIIVDEGQFGSLYYYDLLSRGDIFIKLNNRDSFSQILYSYKLDKLINIGTLLTPYMYKLHNIEFVMYNSLVFTILFSLTLVFIIYISNYVDIISNRKKYSIKYILGHGTTKILNENVMITSFLLILTIFLFIFSVNISVYIAAIILDYGILVYLFKSLIKNDVAKVEKGG